MDALLYLVAIFASTAVVEFCVLSRWFGRRSLAVCVFGVAIPSGVFWTMFSWTLAWIGSRAKAATEGPLASSDYFMLGCFFVVWTLIFSGVALIPAGLTAVIYRRSKSQI